MRGVRTFFDTEAQKRSPFGDLHRDRVIEASRAFVVVLSKGYADSRSCLKELTEIMQSGRLILPIFYDVQPSDVRHERGPFEAAFRQHEKNNEIEKTVVKEWRDALRCMAEMAGFDLTGSEGRKPLKSCLEQISVA
ncbi:Toll/interleukin-1 receptor-like protein [Nymphaea thermarum]|nr:Toll/interleukin-1 receptor-like protein [Nymphaea thermarum]